MRTVEQEVAYRTAIGEMQHAEKVLAAENVALRLAREKQQRAAVAYRDAVEAVARLRTEGK